VSTTTKHPVLELVLDLRQSVESLSALYPDRRFTLDGHLVGSIGEVLAAEQYSLQLLPASTKTHDALAPDGRQVQIKLTQRNGVGLSSCPEHLLVHKLHDDNSYKEIYNGPGKPVWAWCRNRMQKNGQARISLSRLRSLMTETDPKLMLPLAETIATELNVTPDSEPGTALTEAQDALSE